MIHPLGIAQRSEHWLEQKVQWITYGEVVLTMVGFAAVMAMVMIGGFIFGGEVA